MSRVLWITGYGGLLREGAVLNQSWQMNRHSQFLKKKKEEGERKWQKEAYLIAQSWEIALSALAPTNTALCGCQIQWQEQKLKGELARGQKQKGSCPFCGWFYKDQASARNQEPLKRETQPWPVWQLGGWVSSHKAEDHWFDSQSGHMPGLQARSLLGGMQEGADQCFSQTLMFLSLSFSLPSPLSKM